jgi:hypothetical protein
MDEAAQKAPNARKSANPSGSSMPSVLSLTIQAFPHDLGRERKALPQAVLYSVTTAGMYIALRNKAWPILDRRALWRTLLPD